MSIEFEAVGTADDKYHWECGKLKVKKTKSIDVDTVTLNFKSENYCTLVEVRLEDFLKLCQVVSSWKETRR